MSARAAARVTARTTADRTASVPVRPRTTEAPKAARPDLKLVPAVPARRTPARSRAASGERRGPFVLLVVGLLVGTALGQLFLVTAINSDSVEASELRTANAELAEKVQGLQQQVVAGSAPAQLAMAATAAGLVPAGSAAYLVIAPDGSSTLRGSVTPAPEPPRPQPAAPQSARSADRD